MARHQSEALEIHIKPTLYKLWVCGLVFIGEEVDASGKSGRNQNVAAWEDRARSN